jgi:hypothetical protein
MSQFSPFSWLFRSANLRIELSFLLGLTFIGLAAQPTFVNLPSNTTIGCEEDLPSVGTVTALSDCPGNVQLNTFIAETGSPVSTCSVSTAFGPGIDWAVWLPVLAAPSVAWNFIGTPSLVFYANGTGRLTGTIQNAANSTWQMNVDVFFENGRDWSEWSALGRNYKNDFGLAGSNYINWSYYELNPVFSHFTGIGVLEGSELSLQHMPANYYFGFQVGLGANNKNANQGLSGWFTYTGTFNGASVNGNGDINVDKVCENVDPACGTSEFTYLFRAEDACGAVAYAESVVSRLDDVAPVFGAVESPVYVSCLQSNNTFVSATDACSSVNISFSDDVQIAGCPGIINRTYTATDGCGNSSQVSQVIYLLDEGVLEFTTFPADATISCSDEATLNPVVEYNAVCVNTTLTQSEEIIAGSCAANYTLIRTYVLSDDCGNSVLRTWTVQVADTEAPAITGVPLSVTLNCGDEVPSGAPTASDNCSDFTLSSNTIVTQEECGSTSTTIWTASDACGNVSTAQQVVVIADNTPPVFVQAPSDIVLTCGAITQNGSDPVVEDDCSDVSVTYSDEVIGEQPCEGSIIRHWVATDACGNASTFDQTLEFSDNEVPVFDFVASPVTVDCSALASLSATASDNCSDVSVSFSDEVLVQGCPGVIVRTYTATDGCGNTAQVQQTIYTITESGAPEFTTFPADAAITCSEAFSLNPVVEYNAGCVNTILTQSEEIIAGICDANYTLIRTYVLTDDCGNSVSRTWTVQVADTEAPAITGVPLSANLNCGDEVPSGTPTASDNCSDFTLTSNTVVTQLECGSTTTNTWTATDACGNVSTAQQVVSIDYSVDPFFTFIPASVTISCGEQFELDTALVSQSCSNVTLTWTDQPLDDCAGSYIRVWRAFDGCGNQAIESTVVTVVDQESPVLIGVPAEQQASCGSELVLPQVSAVDNCDSDVEVIVTETTQPAGCGLVTIYTWTATDDCGNTVSETRQFSFTDNESPIFVELPSNISAACGIIPADAPMPIVTDDCSDVVITYVDEALPGAACSGSILRTWTATDACGNASSAEQIISYVDNVAPVITSYPDDTTVGCDLISFASESDISFEDNCNAAVVSIIDAFIPGGCPAGYNIERTYTVIDACGNSTSVMQTIYVVDEVAPVIFGMPSDTTIACGDELPIAAITATDNCSSNEDITFAVEEQYIPSDCGATILRVYSASDACGNTTSIVQNINVVDLVAPVFVSFPVSASVSCEDAVAVEDSPISFTESCSQVTVTWQEQIIEGDCPSNYTSIRTCTLTDECGNTTVASYTLDVSDTQDPILTGVPSDITLECGDNIPAAQVDVWDNCSAQPQLFISEAMETIGCNTYYTRRWTALDECGNLSQDVQVVTFIDETAPTLSAYPESIVLQCGQTPDTAPVLTANDNCSDNVQVVFTETPINTGACGGLQRTWCATDCSGNEECHTQTITYQPQALPMTTRAQLQAWQSATNRIALELVAHESARWSVDLLDMNGRRIDTWFSGDMSAGETREINADVDFLPSGIYFVQFSNGKTAVTQRLPIVRN